jgi:hypothetical protein
LQTPTPSPKSLCLWKTQVRMGEYLGFANLFPELGFIHYGLTGWLFDGDSRGCFACRQHVFDASRCCATQQRHVLLLPPFLAFVAYVGKLPQPIASLPCQPVRVLTQVPTLSQSY